MMSESLKPKSRIYFLAICGTGMSALAGLLKERGHQVAGSDIAAYPPVGDLLKSLGIPVHLGYDVDDLQKFNPDYVVIGNFIRRDNPQAQYVLEKGIPYGSFPSTLEKFFLQTTRNIVAVGTHGKTTTTSCTAHLLRVAGLDPSFLIGGVPLNFEKSFQVGKGKEFVIEGDEYDTAFFDKESKFLHYRPQIGIFTSMEWDHADIFPTPESMEKMFRKFVHLVPAKGTGVLFHSADWKSIDRLLKEEDPNCECVSYGFDTKAQHPIRNFVEDERGLSFELDGTHFKSPLSGSFNAQNLSGAILAARRCGVKEEILVAAVADFRGVKRRQEVRAKIGEHYVIDDFAHHPTAVREVLKGLKKRYPRHRLITFFEPRSNTSRRNILQKEFETAFVDSDVSFIAPVFRSEALKDNERLDLQKIQTKHQSLGREMHTGVAEDQMIDAAVQTSKKGPSVFVILSNGSFNGLHEKLISALKG